MSVRSAIAALAGGRFPAARAVSSGGASSPWATVPFVSIFAILCLVALAAPWIAPDDPNTQNLLGRLKPPGTELGGRIHYLGTDELGRDLLSRIIYGARISIAVALSSVLLSGTVGTLLGMVAALRRGWVESVIMRVADIVLSVPAILLAIVTVAVLGPGLQNVILILALTRWPRYARVAYGQSLGVANMPYVKLAQHLGCGPWRLLGVHVLPNIIGPLIVVATLEFGLMVLFESGLSFLGLGVQPPTASWGVTLSTGRNYLVNAWWIATLPGLCLFSLILSINVIGDRLRDRLDPGARS